MAKLNSYAIPKGKIDINSFISLELGDMSLDEVKQFPHLKKFVSVSKTIEVFEPKKKRR